MKTFKDLLIELDACKPAKDWAGDKTIEEVVAQCHRGDWLEWLAKKIDVDKRKRVLAGGLCANTVRHLMKDERSTKAVDVAIAYGRGEASDEELNEAAYAATAADADDAAYAADAARAAEAAADAYAANAARGAANAAYDDDDDDANAAWAALENNQRLTANICREVMGEEIINKVNELLKP